MLRCVTPALLVVCATPARATAADVPPLCTPTVARIVSMQGVVELRRAGQRDWAAVTRLDTPVCQGDTVHAGPRSRAALVILPEKFVRLDQNSTVSISIEGEETIVEFFQDETTPRDACGAGYFITRFPRKFKVRTPFVNAAVEGTEFLVSMSCSATSVAVFEGKVSAQTLLANAERFILNSGEAILVGPGEPPAIKVLIKPVDAVQWALYYPPLSQPGPGVGPDQQCDQSAPDERSRCLMVRAEQRLRVGRVDEAQADIDASLKLVPDNSNADALLSVISIAKNDKQRALALAEQATRLDPVNPRGWIALSYAQQASFKLEDALNNAQRAAELEPRSSIALTRVAELMMSLGKIRSAERAAQAAVSANPNDSRAHTILGFVHLAEIDIKKAKADFEAAITRDSSDPLPRLGLGLAIIRAGDLKAGREQIEIAVALDPANSLMRSYVGKAYYEENTKERDKLAATQFGIAEQLDPKDPTPWFYDAILKQTQNRPVEALKDLQKSTELNDNRAVYRSRLLLDEDLAAREASIARVYGDLGFDQLAVTEAAQSLSLDGRNYSAHRFLADLYARSDRTELARASELLQSQLLQPININPVQPNLSFTNLGLLPGTRSATVGPSDSGTLFERNQTRLTLDGVVGNLHTGAAEAILSGIVGPVSYSLGYFGYDTEGFRDNDDLRHGVADAFLQVAVTPSVNLQTEFRRRHTENGDLQLNFDPDQFNPLQRQTIDQDSARLGARVAITPASDLIASVIWSEREGRLLLPDPTSVNLDISTQDVGTQEEAAYLGRFESFSLITGLRVQRIDTTSTTVADFTPIFGVPCPPFFPSCVTEVPFAKEEASFYAYGTAFLTKTLSLTLGMAYYGLSQADFNWNEWSPKIGLQWNPGPSTRVRIAAFQVIKPPLAINQTIEPTEVAGFNQFFDDTNLAKSRRVAIAVDQRLSPHLFAGLEASERTIVAPVFTQNMVFSRFDNQYETLASAYLKWVLSDRWLLSASYLFEDFRRDLEDTFVNDPESVKTQTLPLDVRYFDPTGFFARLSATWVRQEVTRLPTATAAQGTDDFWVFDAAVGYRFPRRHGAIMLDVRNVFDRHFSYYDINFFGPDPRNPRFIPNLAVMLNAVLSF